MSENHSAKSQKLLQKEEEMQYYQRQLNELEEEITIHIKQVKKQQEELEDCYSSDPSFAELLDETQKVLWEKEDLEETIFHDIRQAIKANIENIDGQRE